MPPYPETSALDAPATIEADHMPVDPATTPAIEPVQRQSSSAPTLDESVSPSPAAALTVPDVDLGGNDAIPGQTLEAEAFDLLNQRRFGEAIKVAEALARVQPDSLVPDAIVTVAGANQLWRRRAFGPVTRLRKRLLDVSELRGRDDETRRQHAIGWAAIGSFHLAVDDHRAADHASRKILGIDPDSATGWWHLAASYAGLGWFEEATQCLHTARRLDPLDDNPFSRWQVGKAANRWAMTRTPALWLSAITWIFAGMLAFAVYLTVPYVARERRIGTLEGDVRSLADEHWATDTRRRFTTAAAVLGVVVLWILGLVLLAPSTG